ncbi:dehydrogenase/reductase SDR family member 11-like [Simochromis diagramma]|uniref:dehydrogenase/reductase SDR family member 11-like n=1 Tax=Simochromis diagramma TaxID=43689 RepID=UPI001A7EB6C6|nr:dehydrogenase/reductase SDR family member 11-like [Simochromis diagramma]
MRTLRKAILSEKLLVSFYCSSVEILCYGILVWYASCTEAAQGESHNIITEDCQHSDDVWATNIIKYSSHPNHHLFTLVPSGSVSVNEREKCGRWAHHKHKQCGHQVFPNADVHFYTCSKYAVTALTEGLRQELRAENTHIRATSISPGFVETEFVSRLYRDNSDKAAAVYTKYKSLEAKDLVSAITYVLSAPPRVQIGEIFLEGL